MNHIHEATVNSPDLQFLMTVVREGTYKQNKKDPRIKPFRSIIHFISEIDSIIFYGEDIIVIPTELSAAVTDSLHQLGHQGQVNTLALIKQYFFYPDMVQQVNSVTQSCVICGQIKISKRQEPYWLRPVPQKDCSLKCHWITRS